MTEAQRNNPAVIVEGLLLRRLCRAGVTSLPVEARQKLRGYSWARPDHRTIFEALVRLENVPATALLDQLPAEATRMGFPDLDWEAFLAPSGDEEDERTTRELIEELVSRSKNR